MPFIKPVWHLDYYTLLIFKQFVDLHIIQPKQLVFHRTSITVYTENSLYNTT